MSGSFPSFMSVYSNEDTSIYNHALSENEKHSEPLSLSQFPSNTNKNRSGSLPQPAERRGSLASVISYSTESSPTTTSSTFDSPLMADQSSDSSPESASSAIPPKVFRQPQMRSMGTQTGEESDIKQTILSVPSIPSPSAQVVEESRKNVKNLTIDMQLPSLGRPLTAPALEGSHPFSTPTSPLREPLRTGRKKPTNLTIRTPGFNQLTFGNGSALIPPTPAQKPMLHQAQSSPALHTLASPGVGPAGGMRLTLPSIAQHLNQDPSPGSLSSALSSNLPSLREEGSYQPPQSQEAPERGYTNGPCLIYDTGVYLYLEPTAEEASKFDTVINVAKEIKNPFESFAPEQSTVVSVWRNAGNRQSIAEPQTAMSEFSFKSAVEWPSNPEPTTPTTPRPSSSSQLRRPEYLHVKWDHNSEILADLLPLCQLIDRRVQSGKKVLIHCQLGVSRSASLIIAYGLYKGYEADFHSMYMAVKRRSQWVGPNMSLIYQLTDYKSKCDKGEYANTEAQLKPEWLVFGSENVVASNAEQESIAKRESTASSNQSAESRPVLRLNKELPPVPLFPKDDESRVGSVQLKFAEQAQTIRPHPPRLNSLENQRKRTSSRPLPFRQLEQMSQPMVIPPHRPRIVPGLTFAQPTMDLAMQDVPSMPSLFSPRATEFTAAPFGVTTAGDLATSAQKVKKPPPGAFPGGNEWRNSLLLGSNVNIAQVMAEPTQPVPYDPRSPHQNGEGKEIFRSIDFVL